MGMDVQKMQELMKKMQAQMDQTPRDDRSGRARRNSCDGAHATMQEAMKDMSLSREPIRREMTSGGEARYEDRNSEHESQMQLFRKRFPVTGQRSELTCVSRFFTALFLAFSDRGVRARRGPAVSAGHRAQGRRQGSPPPKNGTMVHIDAAGNRVHMKDGQMMEAKDGSKLMMKNNAIWKQITERGTLRPVQ